MTLDLFILGLVGLAAVGLLLARQSSPSARLLAWVTVLLFAVVTFDAPEVDFRERAARTAAATLSTSASTSAEGVRQGAPETAQLRTQLLVAAAVAGPRAGDLTLHWTQPLPATLGRGPLGAQADLPSEPLELQPESVQLRPLSEVEEGRPTLLRLESPPLREPVEATLVVRSGPREVQHEGMQLGAARPPVVTLQPLAKGPHEVELSWVVAGHRLTARGRIEVVPTPAVLVLEPSGLAAAALRAQGVNVRAEPSLPSAWRQARALVIGQALPADEQQAIVAAVVDGMGLFVLAPGFGAAEEPMRALLPVRPRPPAPDEPGTGAGPEPGDPQPPSIDEPEPPPPPEPEPPRGDTHGASTVPKEPIEVDKRAIAMVLVVDRSGSMGNVLANGNSKMSYAKTSALRTASALGEGDQVALVTFGNKDAGRVELPLTDATDGPAVHAGVEALAHGPERTFLLAGLRAAEALLQRSPAAVKHVVVITDGEFDVSESIALRSVAHRMRTTGHATLSMVSIVDRFTAPEFKSNAELLTRDGGGQFFQVEDATAVPVFVSAEVTRALQRVGREPRDAAPKTPPEPHPAEAPPPNQPPPPELPEVAKPPTPQRLPVRAVVESTLLEPPPVAAWPTLGGAVAGTAPLDARVLLVAGDEGWPLLAFVHRGLGRVGAFAADLCGEPGREFCASEAFSARLALWVQSVLPAEPVRALAPLLVEWVVQPPAPTPHDVDVLTAVAGSPPRPADASRLPAPDLERVVESQSPRLAVLLLLALLGLAVAERYCGLWALRRGRPGG